MIDEVRYYLYRATSFLLEEIKDAELSGNVSDSLINKTRDIVFILEDELSSGKGYDFWYMQLSNNLSLLKDFLERLCSV